MTRCTACGKRAKANRTLGTVPDGERLAFDPDAGRVWRICPACGHWELLGEDASRAALPELAARFAMVPSAGPAGLAKAAVAPRLTLYRVGGAPERAARIVALAEAKRNLLADVPWWAPWLFGAWLVWSGRSILAFLRSPDREAIGVGLPLAFGTLIGMTVTRRLLTRTALPIGEWIRLAIGIGGIALSATRQMPWLAVLGGVAFGALIGWKALDDERRPRTLRWTPGRIDVTFQEGHDDVAIGDEALELTAALLAGYDTPTLEEVAHASARADALPLGDLLDAMAARYGTVSGTLPLNALTPEDRRVLHLALEMARAEPTADLHAALPEARDVAAISERLAAPPGSAGPPPPAPSA